MSQGGEGDPTKSDDEADIDTIELMLRPEEFARLESIWEAQTQASASSAASEPSQSASESSEDLITGPFDVTRLRSEYAETSDGPARARTDSTVELPPLRLTPDADRADPTIALPPLRLTPDGRPMAASPAASNRAPAGRTHFYSAPPAARGDLPQTPSAAQPDPPAAARPAAAVNSAATVHSAVVVQPAPAAATAAVAQPAATAPSVVVVQPAPVAVAQPVVQTALAVQPAPAVTMVPNSAAALAAEPPRAPLSVEQFGSQAALVSKRLAVESLDKAAPIKVGPLVQKVLPPVKAASRQQARWPWLALSSVAAILAIIIVWLFSVDTSPHLAAPAAAPTALAATPVAPPVEAPAEPANAAPVQVPVSTLAHEPHQQPARQQPAHQQPSAAAPVDSVKFRNPFDQREVFEFPAGTTPTEARDAVAQILLQRARDRQGIVAERTRRRASKPRQSGGGAGELVENATRVTN
jgi:hypothetical protein